MIHTSRQLKALVRNMSKGNSAKVAEEITAIQINDGMTFKIKSAA